MPNTDNDEEWVVLKPGEKLPPGEYDYIISKPGYETIIDKMEVTDKPLDINKVLKPNGFILKINTTPEDAKVKVEINGYLIEGKEFSLSPGVYNYEVSKESYSSKTGSVTVVDRNITANIDLVGAKFRLAILCSQSESKIEVQIEGVYISGGVHRVVPGEYNYKVSMVGYADITGTAVIIDKDIVIPVSFKEEKYKVTFDVTPKNALTELQIGRDWSEGIEYELLPGKYQYVVSAKGYKDEIGIIYVTDSDIINYEVNLIPLNNMNPAGRLTIGHKFTIFIMDGIIDGMGKDDKGQISNIPAGNNFIEVMAGECHTVALDSNGRLYAWGDNTFEQCNVNKNKKYSMVCAEGNITAALTTNGKCDVWGKYTVGSSSYKIDNIPNTKTYTHISTNGKSIILIDDIGDIREYGLCEGSNTDAPSTRSINITGNIVAYDYTESQKSAFYINDNFECVESNSHLVFGSCTSVQSMLFKSAYGLDEDGKIIKYRSGINSSPVYGAIPIENNVKYTELASGFINVNAGAIREDGAIIVWGDNEFGQKDMPDGISRLIFVVNKPGIEIYVETAVGDIIADDVNNHTVRVEKGSYKYTVKHHRIVDIIDSVIIDRYSVTVIINIEFISLLIFDILPKDAIVTVNTPNGTLIANAENNHTVEVLEDGTEYTYTATRKNYKDFEGSIEPIEPEHIIPIKLTPLMGKVIFNVIPQDAIITIDTPLGQLTATPVNKYTISVPLDGSELSFISKADKYIDYIGKVTPDDLITYVDVVMEKKPVGKLIFILTPNSAVCQIKNKGNTFVANRNNSHTIEVDLDNTVYDYLVTLDGYEPQKGKVTPTGPVTTVRITLSPSPKPKTTIIFSANVSPFNVALITANGTFTANQSNNYTIELETGTMYSYIATADNAPPIKNNGTAIGVSINIGLNFIVPKEEGINFIKNTRGVVQVATSINDRTNGKWAFETTANSLSLSSVNIKPNITYYYLFTPDDSNYESVTGTFKTISGGYVDVAINSKIKTIKGGIDVYINDAPGVMVLYSSSNDRNSGRNEIARFLFYSDEMIDFDSEFTPGKYYYSYMRFNSGDVVASSDFNAVEGKYTYVNIPIKDTPPPKPSTPTTASINITFNNLMTWVLSTSQGKTVDLGVSNSISTTLPLGDYELQYNPNRESEAGKGLVSHRFTLTASGYTTRLSY